ncbi:hypothetical protein C8F04DRAFT_1336078 [Mycena alexandri]|uniref:Uncharacterized protein n=1 Tax=Mycena alexandri TaxID=1745969 RepID=A0AAD6X955_9AGAR|nr:hypothetical protein C8F04DRAFT_1336078 [Mycena alexandri]
MLLSGSVTVRVLSNQRLSQGTVNPRVAPSLNPLSTLSPGSPLLQVVCSDSAPTVPSILNRELHRRLDETWKALRQLLELPLIRSRSPLAWYSTSTFKQLGRRIDCERFKISFSPQDQKVLEDSSCSTADYEYQTHKNNKSSSNAKSTPELDDVRKYKTEARRLNKRCLSPLGSTSLRQTLPRSASVPTPSSIAQNPLQEYRRDQLPRGAVSWAEWSQCKDSVERSMESWWKPAEVFTDDRSESRLGRLGECESRQSLRIKIAHLSPVWGKYMLSLVRVRSPLGSTSQFAMMEVKMTTARH